MPTAQYHDSNMELCWVGMLAGMLNLTMRCSYSARVWVPYRGGEVKALLPTAPGQPSALQPERRDWDILLTAETHNFPCAVAPYPGQSMGTS